MTVLFDFPFNVDKTTLSAKELIMQEVILTISMLCYFFIKKSNPFSLAKIQIFPDILKRMKNYFSIFLLVFLLTEDFVAYQGYGYRHHWRQDVEKTVGEVCEGGHVEDERLGHAAGVPRHKDRSDCG